MRRISVQNTRHRGALLLCLVIIPLAAVHAQSGRNGEAGWVFGNCIPGKHRGAVTALVHKGETILSAGEDGFLEIWNAQSAAAAERFQLSSCGISAMAARPGTDEICLVESDGLGLYRISAWNYRTRTNIFTRRFPDPMGYITYSMGGKFIIAGGTGGTALILLNAENGDALDFSPPLTGTIGCAATGRSERIMAAYLASGALSYWDLETGTEANHIEVPPNLQSPVLFGNNRYLAGIGARGLTVLDAATGAALAENAAITSGALLCAAGEELFCLVQNRQGAEIHRFAVERTGQLASRGRYSVPAPSGGVTPNGVTPHFSAIAANGTIALGTAAGSLLLAGQDGYTREMTANDQSRIVETAVSGANVAFLAENNTMGFIPLDYTRLAAGRTIAAEQNKAYTRIDPFDENGGGRFLCWQDRDTRVPPAVRSADGGQPLAFSDMPFRTPIRSAETSGGRALFLDSAGNLSVVSAPGSAGRPSDGRPSDNRPSDNRPSDNRPFTFFSVGLLDAAFVDRDRLLLGRSAVSGNAPFLIVNVNTGETVPLPYPCQAAVKVYRGGSGGIYAAVVDQDGEGITTSILRLNTANPAQSIRLAELRGEDAQFSLAEVSGHLAATIGGEGAAIYAEGGVRQFERSPGFPAQIVDGGRFFISLDAEGNICWHDGGSGKLLAVFRLYEREWTLQTERGVIRGPVAAAH
jgi:WD40 repeat protein